MTRRADTQLRRDVADDLYGLGGGDFVIMAGVHIMATTIERLTDVVESLVDETAKLNATLEAMVAEPTKSKTMRKDATA